MIEDRELKQKFMEAVGAAHLYHQQLMIDEFPIDYPEFRNRINPYDIPTVMTTFADELANDEHSTTILQRALDLINNPPA
jgi:hypothetical protein